MATGINIATTAVVGAAGYMSLHTGNPGASGASEVTGSGYARKAVSWGSVSSGTAGMSGTTDFTGPASGAAKFVGLWTQTTGGDFIGSAALTGDQAFNAAGQYTVLSSQVKTTLNT